MFIKSHPENQKFPLLTITSYGLQTFSGYLNQHNDHLSTVLLFESPVTSLIPPDVDLTIATLVPGVNHVTERMIIIMIE